MPVPGGVSAPSANQAPQSGEIPFIVGSNCYREAPFSTQVFAMGAASQEFINNVTPGGFLRGITMQVTSTGGVIGTGVLANDIPYSIIQSASLEDISGGPILYPMGAYQYALCQKYLRPWDGDPSKRGTFSATINPAFTLRFFSEVKDTLAVLANTDARAQYRFRYTVAAANQAGPYGLTTTAATTPPTLTIKLYIESWAQPDLQDLLGNSIQQLPDGLTCSRFLMHETPAITAANNVTRETLTGNELRGIILVVRNGDANKTRVDLTDANAGAIDFRLDSRRLWKMTPSQIIEEMNAFYFNLGNGTWTREAGVFVIPRFSGAASAGDPTAGQGEYWLQTVEQTLLQLEYGGADITTQPGTLEIIYDALAIAGELAPELEGC
ncbi:MAG: hypothetical protein KGL39_32105 [Patescibacteria group bacterium]|nr:hypothetical protein [Patescibacteria group bacterium]